MGWFEKANAALQDEATQDEATQDEDVVILWGESCFAEYREDNDDQPWTVQKYDSDWSFCLDEKSDVLELMKRLDARLHPPGV